MPTEDEKARLESVWKIHSYTNEYIRFADQKAGVFLAFQSGLLAAMFTVKLHHLCAEDPFGSWVAVAALVAFVGLAVGVVCALFAVAPRLRIVYRPVEWVWPWATVEPQAPPALIFWEQVLKHGEPNAYAAAVVAADTAALIQAVAQHTFVLASIANGKYRWINRSIAISLLPAILATLAMFFHRVMP